VLFRSKQLRQKRKEHEARASVQRELEHDAEVMGEVGEVDEVEVDEFYTPVQITPEGTAFPIDFLSPTGLAMKERSCIAHRTKEREWVANALSNAPKDGRRGYNGHNDFTYAKLATGLRLLRPLKAAMDRQMYTLEKTLSLRQTYVLPNSMSVKSKYARFLFRTRPLITERPLTYPFTFYPFSHAYKYTQEHGTEN